MKAATVEEPVVKRYTPPRLARMLGVGQQSVRLWLKTGLLKGLLTPSVVNVLRQRDRQTHAA